MAVVVVEGARNFDILDTCPTKVIGSSGRYRCLSTRTLKTAWSMRTKRRRKSFERSRRTINIANTNGSYLAGLVPVKDAEFVRVVVGVLPITFEYVFRWKIYDYRTYGLRVHEGGRAISGNVTGPLV